MNETTNQRAKRTSQNTNDDLKSQDRRELKPNERGLAEAPSPVKLLLHEPNEDQFVEKKKLNSVVSYLEPPYKKVRNTISNIDRQSLLQVWK
jgi:hypothetical protein